MANEFKLSYTASDINERLGRIDNLAKKSDIPSKLSELVNDGGFATKIYVDEAIANLDIPSGDSTPILDENGKLLNSVLPDGYPYMDITEIVPEQSIEVIDIGRPYHIDLSYGVIEIGKSYTVKFNEVEYNCVAWSHTLYGGIPFVGNATFFGIEGVGESVPFAIGCAPDFGFDLFCPTAGIWTVSITMPTFHKISQDYLPDSKTLNLYACYRDMADDGTAARVPALTPDDILSLGCAQYDDYISITDLVDVEHVVIFEGQADVGVSATVEYHRDNYGRDYATFTFYSEHEERIRIMSSKEFEGTTTPVATEEYVDDAIDNAIANLVNSAPDAIAVDTTLTQSGQAADAKAVGDAIAQLSDGNVDQTSPEYFGAMGDGVTDDAEAIMQALAASKNVVFDGDKTYAVGSTIVIPADSMVDFRGATIVPKGNHDVIRVKPGSCIENLVVRCTDVAGWDKSAVVFYGGDMFRASNPTRINNAKLYNDATYNDGVENKGNGLYMYVDKPGQFVEGLSITDLLTTGFGKGVFINGLNPEAEYTSNLVAFIGANNFCKYWSFKDTYGIYIESEHTLDRMTSNFFSDMNIQSGGHGNSEYAIYCNGSNNYFSGCIYDYFYLNPNDPVKAIFFGKHSNTNVVETSSGVVYESGFVTDYGIANRVKKRCYEETLMIPNDSYYNFGMIGNQDDILAFADKNMDCTLESLDGDLAYGKLANVFDPTPGKTLTYRESVSGNSDKRAKITINFKKAVGEITNIILQFSRHCVPTNIRVTFYGETEARRVYDTTENVNQLVVYNYKMSMYPISTNPVYNVAKIEIEIGGFANPDGNGTYKTWALERIMATGSNATGKTWMRSDGGDVFGNIKFGIGQGAVLTSESGKKYLLLVSDDGTLSTREYIEQEEEAPDAAALIPVMASGASWYNTSLAVAEQNTITGIAFVTSYEPTGSEDASWPCDVDGEGLIMAYRTGTNVVIAPTTGSDKIRLNTDSSYMFANDGTKANFAALASIAGTEMWVADRKTSFAYICTKAPITTPVTVPTGVNNMSYAFSECRSLTVPPELPDGVTALLSAFSKCSAMQLFPEIPSTVTSMDYAFLGCSMATNAPSAIPATVTSMNATFRLCGRMNGTIEIDATNLGGYAQCFDGACSTSGEITLTGTSPYLADLAATNTQGKVTVAQ